MTPVSVQPDEQARMNMAINGKYLSGVTVAGFWVWTCPQYPDLVEIHSGKDDIFPMLTDFMNRASDR